MTKKSKNDEVDWEVITIKRNYSGLRKTLVGGTKILVEGKDGIKRPVEEEAIKYFEGAGYYALPVFRYFPLPDMATIFLTIQYAKTFAKRGYFNKSQKTFYPLPEIYNILKNLKQSVNKTADKKGLVKLLLESILKDRKQETEIYIGYDVVEYTKEMRKKELEPIEHYIHGKNKLFDRFTSLPFNQIMTFDIDFLPTGKNIRGVPDLFVWNPDDCTDHFFCEVKSQTDKLSGEQICWINQHKHKVRIKILKILRTSR